MRPEQRLRQETVERRLSRMRPDAPAPAPTLRLVDPLLGPGGEEPVLPAAVPRPGRHAGRRAWLPPTLRGPVGLEPWHVGVVASVLLVALAATCWWLLHRTPTLSSATPTALTTSAPLVPLSAAPSGTAPAAVSPDRSGPPSTATSAATSVTIDVAGRVRRPGVRTLPAGSRVVDALQAAGGVRPGVDLSGLNQARVLADGEQILVGHQAAITSPGAAGATSGAGAAGGGLVNLNTATAEQLDTLPGVGPVTAQAILDYRTQHSGFGSVQELVDIEGIGEKTLAKLEPHVTV